MWKRFILVSFVIVNGFFAGILSGCDKKAAKLVVYSGKGMERVMEEVKHDFERKYNIQLDMIYAGSETLLATISKTRIGDVFIPGSVTFIEKAGDLVLSDRYVALHVPAFSVRKDNPKNIQFFEDLLQPGVKIAVGNKDMCAIGRISERIFKASGREEEFTQNVSITGSTVNELLDLVLHKDVDASLIWSDMMAWPEASDLKMIEIPLAINKPKQIHIAILATTTDRKNAALFTDFVAAEGKSIFEKHGFGEE